LSRLPPSQGEELTASLIKRGSVCAGVHLIQLPADCNKSIRARLSSDVLPGLPNCFC